MTIKAVDKGHNNDQAFAEFLKSKVSSFKRLREQTDDLTPSERNQFIARTGVLTVQLSLGLLKDDSASLV
jgi:hypothetical protein